MPRSSTERAPRTSNVSLGDVTLDTDQYVAGTLKERRWDTNDQVITVPAGAYSVYIRNNDPAVGSSINVNGEDIGFNRYFERSSRENLVRKEQDFTPEILIQNPDGRRVSISVSYPSSSSITPSSL